MARATIHLDGQGDPSGLARAVVLALVDHGVSPETILHAAAGHADMDLVKAHVHVPGGEQPTEVEQQRIAVLLAWYNDVLLPDMVHRIGGVLERRQHADHP